MTTPPRCGQLNRGSVRFQYYIQSPSAGIREILLCCQVFLTADSDEKMDDEPFSSWRAFPSLSIFGCPL